MSQSIKSIDQQTLLRSSWIKLCQIRKLKAHQHERYHLQTDPMMNQTILSISETPTKIKSWKNPEFPSRSHERKTFFWPFSIWRFFGAICLSFLNWNNRLLYYWLGPTIHNSILKVCPKFQGSKSHFSEVNDLLDEPQSKKLEEKIVHSVAP